MTRAPREFPKAFTIAAEASGSGKLTRVAAATPSGLWHPGQPALRRTGKPRTRSRRPPPESAARQSTGIVKKYRTAVQTIMHVLLWRAKGARREIRALHPPFCS